MAHDSWWIRSPTYCALLISPCARYAFSPDEQHLAWVAQREPGVVYVTEFATLRTVCSFEGANVTRLRWVSEQTLAVLRRPARAAMLHLHAVPDGGEFARISLAEAGVWALSLQVSAPYGEVLVVPESWRHDSTERGFMIRGDDGVVLHQFEVATVLRHMDVQGSMVPVWSPDGSTLALSERRDARLPRRATTRPQVVLVRPGGGIVRRYVLNEACEIERLRWTGSTQMVLGLRVSPTARIEHELADGEQRTLAAWSVAPDTSVSTFHPSCVHPERDRFVLVVGARLGADVVHTAHVVLLSDAPRTTTHEVTLSRRRATAAEGTTAPHEAGVCWDRTGALLAFSLVARNEGVVTCRTTLDDAPRTLVHLPLGMQEGAVHLSLQMSAARRWAVARWSTPASDGARQLTRIAVIDANAVADARMP